MSKLQTPNPKPRVYVATGTSPGTWSPEISGQPMVQPEGRIIPWITLGKKRICTLITENRMHKTIENEVFEWN